MQYQPQRPQCAELLSESTHSQSEPYVDAEQARQPLPNDSQVAHLPPTQYCPNEQNVEQVPQGVVLPADEVMTSLRDQSVRLRHTLLHIVLGAEHWQVPAWQVEPVGQALPHSPQFFESVWRSVQLSPHTVLLHAVQVEPLQTSLLSQAWAHEPQFARSS